MAAEEAQALEALDVRIRTLLPEVYQDSYEDAAARADAIGRAEVRARRPRGVGRDVGELLRPGDGRRSAAQGRAARSGRRAAIDADFDRYDEVADEICRGIRLVTGLRPYVSPNPGWVRVSCPGDAMAGWLLRAIVMENVAARRQGAMLDLPAAPQFRLEKEIKNVITVIAKTCHYWMGHIPRAQQQAIAELFLTMDAESPLVEPALPDAGAVSGAHSAHLAETIQRDTGLRRGGARLRGMARRGVRQRRARRFR